MVDRDNSLTRHSFHRSSWFGEIGPLGQKRQENYVDNVPLTTRKDLRLE
jgi:hypothetical protein